MELHRHQIVLEVFLDHFVRHVQLEHSNLILEQRFANRVTTSQHLLITIKKLKAIRVVRINVMKTWKMWT